jgi:predicted nucleic acid-binding protein
MSMLTVRQIDPADKEWLQREAARLQLSMEEMLPEGKRRDELTFRFDALVADLFGAGVYDFITTAAERCASIMARKRVLGEPLDDHLPDDMIAGIAAQAGLPVATRNRSELRKCGLVLIDPWATQD